MTRLLSRIANADNSLTRAADGLARRMLPKLSASGSCYMRCTGINCWTPGGYFGRKKCEYCSGGYWTSNCYCSTGCV